MAKQTARNNDVLKAVKLIYNDKIFKRAAEIMNATGETDCIVFLGQFSTNPTTVASLTAEAAIAQTLLDAHNAGGL